MSDRPLFVAGLDLGQAADATALTVLEVSGERDDLAFGLRYAERHLEKPYPWIVQRVGRLADRLAHRGDCAIAYDATGVGRAVGDLLRAANLAGALHAVTITGGDAESSEGREHRVPKADLVGALQVVLQGGRLRMAKRLGLVDLVVRELLGFRVKVSANANETFEARSGLHDDMALALMLAVWLGRKLRRSSFNMEKFVRASNRSAATATAPPPAEAPPPPPKNESSLQVHAPKVLPDPGEDFPPEVYRGGWR